MNWLFLGVAIIFEIIVAISAGKANGFNNIKWTLITLISGAIGTYFLSLALLTFDVGIGYALWTSLAGIGIVIFGRLFLHQKLTSKKMMGIAMIIFGVVGLQLNT
ncbi:DMT family transporter [Faucicola atlantae]|uniref:Ligand-binding protein SH3 n=1 Tax=Faucicola atlantae TaxID=34059 RepID=A0A1B8QGF6_9GAMM|nr:SMR family transporter [Moraxella atlantae]OBX81134.1 ligand-binding protein SH3 [Moraxella atlantae]